jgi:hypothetical protein
MFGMSRMTGLFADAKRYRQQAFVQGLEIARTDTTSILATSYAAFINQVQLTFMMLKKDI